MWSRLEFHVLKVSAITILNNIRQGEADCADIAGPVLRVTLFGHMRAEDASRQSVLPRSRKTRGVLAVLALAAPRPVLRARLAALLWSRRAKEQARASLRQSLHELQRTLGPHAQSLLQSDRHNVLLNDAWLWVDVRALAAATATNSEALDVFQPNFLDDLNGLDPAFDVWISEERHRATSLARSLAEELLSAQRDVRGRLVAAERLLLIERAHDGGWQVLIRSYLQQGDRAAAQLAFERYSTAVSLAGMSPSADLEGLVRGTPPTRSSTVIRTAKPGLGTGVRVVVLPPRPLEFDGFDGLLTGLAGELTAAVSCFRWLSCVAGAARIDPPPLVGDEPKGEYLLDTTVQRSGNSVRIIIHLLDRAAGNEVVWAKRFDRELSDLLSLQSEIAAETAAQIDPMLLLREGARRIGMAGATGFDLTLQAIPAVYRLEPAGIRAAGDLLATAVDLDASNAAAHAWWAYWHLLLVGQGWADDPVAATSRAGDLAARAVTLDPGDARAVTLVGHVRAFLHKRPQEARVPRTSAVTQSQPASGVVFLRTCQLVSRRA